MFRRGKKVPELDEFYVDLSLGKNARDLIRVGDFVGMDAPVAEIGDCFVSKHPAVRTVPPRSRPRPSGSFWLPKISQWLSIQHNTNRGGFHECSTATSRNSTIADL